MGKSLFDKNAPQDKPPTPYERLAPEIAHLKKGSSVRHGPNAKKRLSPWLIILVLGGLVWLYIMDPVVHAWYRGEAIRTYLYLHNYGAGPLADELLATGLFSADEIHTLNNRHGSFQDYYVSPTTANREAEIIIGYMKSVQLLHDGKYDQLDPVGKLRYYLFVRPGIPLPTQWPWLDPSVGENASTSSAPANSASP